MFIPIIDDTFAKYKCYNLANLQINMLQPYLRIEDENIS
jgi:hypothetical protein